MHKYEYTHGGNAFLENRPLLDLSANINPLGLPEGVAEAIKNAIEQLTRYPDSQSTELCAKIGMFEKVSESHIFCGNGASDIIFRLPRAIKPVKIMVTAPTFSDYERAAASFGAEVIHYYLTENNGFKIDDGIIDALEKHKIDLLFICNPNNPTGILTKRDLLLKILEICRERNTYVVIDECFIDFTNNADETTMKPYLEKFKNLIILKAFTKIFAMPGIRVGYALCSDTSFINKLHFHGADWPVSNLAQAAALAALDGSKEYLEEAVEYVAKERAYIKKELENLGFTTFDSAANYVFFKNNSPIDLWEKLNEKGVRIRSCGNFKGLSPSYFRVGISQTVNNKKFIEAVKEVTKWQNR